MLIAFAVLILVLFRLQLPKVDEVAATLTLVAGVLAAIAQFGKAILNPFRSAIDRYARRPDYEAHLGFTAEADRDVGVLTRLLTPDDRHGLAVFVDDLDRCSSAHIVEVVEAMNQIFNSDQQHRCVFILGLDPDVVSANINVAYAGTVERLITENRSLGERFGREFLAKLVQLSVSLPEPHHEALKSFMAKITNNEDLARNGRGERVANAQGGPLNATGAGEYVAKPGEGQVPLSSRYTEASAPATIRDSPDIAEAEFAALPYLERNPRAVKRFHNAFRLQLYVAREDERVEFSFSRDELVALSKWVVIRLRWPEFGRIAEDEPELLKRLEAAANDESPPEGTMVDAQRLRRWIDEPLLRALVRDREARRPSVLAVKTFLRVT
jgi:hypothetical protein